VSFLDYLKEHRGQFIDHRVATPIGSHRAGDELDTAHEDARTSGGGATPRGVGRRRRSGGASARFRHVRPAFTPLPYSDPLPYEEPWERALR